MKSKCLSERLKAVLKRRDPRTSNLVAIKHLCNHAQRLWEASVRSARARFCTDAQGPGPALCWWPVRGGGEKPSPGEGRGFSQRKGAGSRHWDDAGEVACRAQPSLASLPAALIP